MVPLTTEGSRLEMTSKDTPPPAADDFPEFAEPPRHRPHAELAAERKSPPEPANDAQEKLVTLG